MDLTNLSLGGGAAIALLGYCVVFLGIVLLMLVVLLMGRIMINSQKKQAAKAAAAAPAAAETPLVVVPAPDAPKAPGTAGDLKLYDTDPRDAAMIMAIVANQLGKPLNELRFISIKEVKDE
ncbi:MAG: OadG family protein [Oscillospiraceae bacterium]|nr:OadG family protein [Oscillospiraceae bacterium]